MTADLFPETLLVRCEHDRVFTTSLKIAEHFHKRHTNVLRLIRDICDATPETVWRLNFEPRDYLDERGKSQPFYELTHDGFAIAVMGFTGPAALAWKWQFLAAFRELEHQLHALQAREAQALYHLRPRWQPILANPTLRRKQLIGLTGHQSEGAITACRRRMRQVGLLTTPPPAGGRLSKSTAQ